MTLLKTIAVCLVLANVGYFLWTRGVGSPAGPVQPLPAQSLRLASESPEGARAASADAAAGALAGTAGSGDAVETPPGAATPAVAAPEVRAAAAAPAAEGTGSALLTNVRRCVSVGPFRDVSEAAHAATTLRAGGYDPRQRVADGDVWAGVWVYLPLPASRAAMDQVLTKLKAGGIDDALEMPGPNDASVISLGLYSEGKRAQSRVAQVQGLGFNPGIADRKRTGNVYWIDIDLKPTDGLLNPADLQGEAGRIVRLEVKGCPPPPGAPP